MELRDYSPSEHPTLDEQRDALAKGLGRAVQWARAGRLDEETLLDACLRDQRYDRQCEEDRTSWMLDLAETSRAAERLRSKLLAAFEQLETEDETLHLCEMACAFAKRGDTEFIAILREIVLAKPFPSSTWLGESDLIDADGDAGFRFCLRVRGESLRRRKWDADDEDLVFRAGLVLGDERAAAILKASEDPDVRRFRTARQIWLREAGDGGEACCEPESLANLTLDDLCARLDADTAGYFTLRRWGREAKDAARLAAFDRACDESDPERSAALLTTLLSKPLPQFDERMLLLCRSENRTLRWRAYHVASEYADPQVREFALEQLRQEAADSSVVSLFVRNFESGDERLLVDAMMVPTDADERHRLGIELADVLSDNPAAPVDELALIAAFETPCSMCRGNALELLRDRGEVPGWLAAEAVHDCAESTRALFAAGDVDGG